MTSPVNAFMTREATVPHEVELPETVHFTAETIVEYIDDIDALQQIRSEWDALTSSFRTPLLTHNWFASCARAFSYQEQTEILLVRRQGEMDAIAPLAFRGKFHRRLEIMGSFVTNEPGGIIFRNRHSLEQLWEAVFDMKTTVFLKGIRYGSPEAQALECMLHSRKIRYLAREEQIPWVNTAGKWVDFEKSISSSRRSSFRRLRRLAESKGIVVFEVVTPSPENVDGYLNELFKVEAAGWKGRTGTAMRSFEALGTFFRTYSRLEAGEGKLRLFFLKVGGQTIAGQLTVIRADRLWIFKIGHDESWSWCSPGILLMNEVIKYCFDSGLESCEMLGSDEPWLHIWTNESHTVVTYRIYPGVLDALSDLLADFTETISNKVMTRFAKRKGMRKSNADQNTQ